ncbi:amidohydrolase family protein [Phenylobacterium sp. J367]|uniref:amidohydrolase family protein n=1 Tax=Phenylobacterium sp. J367 TaxID=2898435 RepID=UPI002151C9B4|nr:amidohydrolase family protein [Phenylobacterium sp. J367]
MLQRIGAKVAPFGWHIVVYFEAPDLAELKPLFSSLPTKVVVDHMGRPDVKLGTDHPQWRAFVDWMAEDEDVWSKVSCPERLSVAGPPYDDVVPFQREIVETFPDRVLWGTDWPHPNLKGHMVDDGVLVDQIPKFAVTEELRQKLLVDNPMRLYWDR